MLLSVLHPIDTVNSVSTIPYKETGTVVVKKVFGDTLVIASRLGQVQSGDIVATQSSGFNGGIQYARIEPYQNIVRCLATLQY